MEALSALCNAAAALSDALRALAEAAVAEDAADAADLDASEVLCATSTVQSGAGGSSGSPEDPKELTVRVRIFELFPITSPDIILASTYPLPSRERSAADGFHSAGDSVQFTTTG